MSNIIRETLAKLGYTTDAEIEALGDVVPMDLWENTFGLPFNAVLDTARAAGIWQGDGTMTAKQKALLDLPCTIMPELEEPPFTLDGPFSDVFVDSIEAMTGLPKEFTVKNLPPIRNQERRGTCVAFATISALEVALGGKKDMSEQFQYFSVKQDDGIPDMDGSWVRFSFPALMKRGVCTEKTWPYVPDDTDDPGQGPAPKGAEKEALKCRPSKIFAIEATDVAAIKTALTKGHCVSFSVPVFNSWLRNVETRRNGKIGMPIPNEGAVGGHAMAFVGYCDDASWPGGGYFILRNSWGAEWAAEHKTGAGYGSIPYAYIEQYGKEAYALCL